MRLVWSLFMAALAMFFIFAAMRAAAKNVIAAYRNRDDEDLFRYWVMGAAMNFSFAIWTAAAYVAVAVTSDGAFE